MRSVAKMPGGMAVQFKLLGVLEFWVAGARTNLTSVRERAILGMLLLNNGHVVSVDRLIEAVWSDSHPTTARTQVQICISHLRRLFGRFGMKGAIETTAPGYRLEIGAAFFDLTAFEELLRSARQCAEAASWERAAEVYDEALALWRGDALSGLDSSIIRRAAVRLDEYRLLALEECIDAKLNAGHFGGLTSELMELVAEHPFRERFQVQLIVALCRNGRKADALRAFAAARRIFAVELGLEPSEHFQKLEQAVLAGKLDPVISNSRIKVVNGVDDSEVISTTFR